MARMPRMARWLADYPDPPKTGRCRFSPLPCQFFRKKDHVRMWSQNRKIHRWGKAGLNCLHDTIHPCLAENENHLCHFLSLPSCFFLQCKWGLNDFFLKDILKDQSHHKVVSHGQLVAFTQQHRDHASLVRVYNKSQLLALCEAYGIRLSARATKQVLAQALLKAIAENPYIPFTATLHDRTFRVVGRSESQGHIRIRLSRGN